MFHIAFCDDEAQELDSLKAMTERYIKERNAEIHTDLYLSPYELLEDIEKGVRFDILFLDVIMPGQNGIETAKEIRKSDHAIKIIFLTSSPEFAVQSYTVKAYNYLVKPIRQEEFFTLADGALAECSKEEEECLLVRNKSSISRIPIQEIEYCEVIGRTLFLHLGSGEVTEMNGSMEELTKKLMTYGNFLRVHRSYLINLDFVKKINPRTVSMSCLADIPIPHGKYNEIKDTYLEHVFVGGDEPIGFHDHPSE